MSDLFITLSHMTQEVSTEVVDLQFLKDLKAHVKQHKELLDRLSK